MARRFTDTEKWRDEWWGSLNNDYRMIWLYLVDSCSIAGIWKKDFRGLNFNCNTNITEQEFLRVFNDRLIDRGNFYFIPKFLRYQCPKGLNSNKPAILSIVKELEQNNLTGIITQSLGNDFLIIKGKGKGKGTDKGEGKGTGKGMPETYIEAEIEQHLKDTTEETETLSKYIKWTDQILDNNDQHFETLLFNERWDLDSKIFNHLVKDHLGLLHRYPNMRPKDQGAFRYSLLKHIRENKDKKNGTGRINGKAEDTAATAEYLKQHYSAKAKQ